MISPCLRSTKLLLHRIFTMAPKPQSSSFSSPVTGSLLSSSSLYHLSDSYSVSRKPHPLFSVNCRRYCSGSSHLNDTSRREPTTVDYWLKPVDLICHRRTPPLPSEAQRLPNLAVVVRPSSTPRRLISTFNDVRRSSFSPLLRRRRVRLRWWSVGFPMILVVLVAIMGGCGGSKAIVGG